MGIEFNIDTNGTIVFVNKLEKLHRAALPNSVRNTLNSLAFDLKKQSMPASARKTFKNRNKNFFKAGSRVDLARGFDVDSMKSTTGFIPFGGNNMAIEDLEQQERGGTISGRTFIAVTKGSSPIVNAARTGKSSDRNVSKRNRLSNIKNVIKVNEMPGSSRNQKFVKAVSLAGPGGHVLTSKALIRVNNIRKVGGRLKFRLTGLYSVDEGRNVRIKATHFMQRATEQTAKKGETLFIKEAKKQFERFM